MAVIGVTAIVVVSRLRTTTTPLDRIVFEGPVGTAPGEPGVYEYETVGFEAVDALGGGRHDYPDHTSMTIVAGPCGPIVRWQPLEERWTEWEHCGPELGITVTSEYHEWFGVPDVEREECAMPRPVFVAARDVLCVAGATTETYSIEILGLEDLIVDGQVVEAVRTRRRSAVDGESVGVTVVDEWRLAGTPLILRLEAESSNVTSTPIGDVGYTEHVSLVLRGLLPTG